MPCKPYPTDVSDEEWSFSAPYPSDMMVDGCTLQSSCESGPRTGYDGCKRRRGSKVHMAVDTLGHLLAVYVTPANEQERAQASTQSHGALGGNGLGRQGPYGRAGAPSGPRQRD